MKTLTPFDLPKEKGSLHTSSITLYFVLLGGASGCGWNAGLNCIDYFAAKYPNYNVQFIFPLAPYVAQLLTILLITKFSAKLSYNARMLTALVSILVVTGLLPFEAAFFKETQLGMYIIMTLLFILGFNNNLCYASLAGLTGQIEGKYTAYFLIGTGVNSLAMSFMRQATLFAFNPSTEEEITNIVFYFSLTIAYLFFCIHLHCKFIKSEFYKFHFPTTPPQKEGKEQLQDQEGNILAQPLNNSNPTESKKDFKTMLSVLREVKFQVFLLVLSYAQLLMSIPGLMLKKDIPGMAAHTKTISMLIIFNIFFILGKKLGQYRQYYNEYVVLSVVLFRFVLVGFFIVQAISIEVSVFRSILFAYINIAVFGLTMGFVNVALFILGPEKVKSHRKEVAGFLSVLGANVGLIIGAVVALPFRNVGHMHPHPHPTA